MKALLALLGFVFAAHTCLATVVEELKLKAPRGTEVSVSIGYPSAQTMHAPVLVVAPGQGYHMNLPLIQQVSEQAVANGFVVYRFNWSYFTADPQGQPSEDLSTEIEDMRTVIAHAQKNTHVDPTKMVLAGKSLGTWVSYAVFAADESFKGLVLMTPICTDSESGKVIGEESYPGFHAQKRPISLVLGNADAACQTEGLFEFLKGTNGNVSVNIFAGGHSFTTGAPDDPATAKQNALNVSAAASATAYWAGVFSAK